MRVLIHTDQYYPLDRPCAFRMKQLADTLAERGNEVVVITSTANKTKLKIAGAERILYAPAIRMKKKSTIMRLLSDLSFAISSVFSAFAAGKADVVITTSPPLLIGTAAWIISKIKSAKLVFEVRDIWPDVAVEMNSFSERSFYYRAFDCIANFMYRHADLIPVVTPGKINKISQKLTEKHREKVCLVSNGFDENAIRYPLDEALVDKYHLNEKFTCVFVGNIGLAQDLRNLLELAVRFPQETVQFLVFGTGVEAAKLEKQARVQGIDNLHFCGMLNHTQVYTILKKAKISFVPLKNANMRDSVPSKLYEALGLGCPVLLLAEGNACDLVYETGFGRCVSPDEVEKLPAVFQEMMENYEELLKRRESAMRLMKEKYSRQKINVGYERMLHELCQTPKGCVK